MAREVKKANRGEDGWITHIVDIDDNRSDPDPFTVEIHPATGAEFAKELSSHLKFTGREGAERRKEMSENAMREMFKDRVRNPYGYAYPHKDTGEMLRPKTSVELYDVVTKHGDAKEQSVLTGIFEAISDESKLRAGLRETSGSRSEPTS